MNLNQLHYFISVAETGSFTKAAMNHYISQTAITQQIRVLEEKVGTRLFERNSRPVTKVLRIMYKNIEDTISINEICDAVGYSRAYIFKEFKKNTGKSVMAYYTGLKVERAKQLLRERELSVRQIAERLGFDSANYFSKVFRAHTGQTPTAYQKRAFAMAKK